MEFLFIGSIVPDELPYINKAFSRAGNMCQLELLKGFIKAGITPSAVLSLRPEVSCPKSHKVFFRSASAILENPIRLDFFPFINITPIKQFSVGVAAFFSVLFWGWRMRRSSQRIIYTFNISVPPGIFLLVGAWLTRSKCVAMIYDICVPGETAPVTIFNKLDYWLHNKTLKLFDALVVITDAIARDFAPDVPFLCVEGGIKTELIEQYRDLEGLRNHNSDNFTMVAAGRLDEVNGIREIIAAFSLLKGERYQLHIAGTGPLEDFVKASAAHDPRIQFYGFIPFDEVLKLYASADLLLNIRLTQRINTQYFFPSKTMEYLASGVPVITTCPGNVAEEYADLAYLLNDEAPTALANLILKVEAIPTEQRFARASVAREYIFNHKTWDAQAVRISHFLRQISGATHGAR
jgi:glycosyltransferase involved in cell wall biosynthesis